MHLFKNFHQNPSVTFRVIVRKEKQKSKRTRIKMVTLFARSRNYGEQKVSLIEKEEKVKNSGGSFVGGKNGKIGKK